MKKCPFCNAEIEENARFCLYCMQPLEKKQVIDPQPQKKNHRLLLWLILPVLLVVVLLLFLGKTPPNNAPTETFPTEETTEATANEDTFPTTEATQPEATQNDTQIFSPEINNEQQINPTPSSTTPQPSTPQPSVPQPSTPQLPQTTLPTVTEPVTKPTTPTESIVTEPTLPPIDYGNGIPGTEGYRTQLSIQFPYSDDDYPTFAPVGIDVCAYTSYEEDREILGHTIKAGQYVVYGNDANRCGIHEISPYINGTEVVAIAAACDLVMLTVPETVVVIDNYALSRSNAELKYLCFKGDLITMPENALPPMEQRWYTIVIRCSAQCKNAQGEYWKDIAGRYGAVWEEWNG